MRSRPEYTYRPNKMCDWFCLKCYDETCWMNCQASAIPIKGFRSIEYILYSPLKPKTKIFSEREQEGFKVKDESKNVFVCYLRLWYYVWYNIYWGIKNVCTFVKGIF